MVDNKKLLVLEWGIWELVNMVSLGSTRKKMVQKILEIATELRKLEAEE